MNLTDEQFKIYLAGYFDAHGNTHICRAKSKTAMNGYNHTISVVFNSRYEELVKMLVKTYGGHYYIKQHSRDEFLFFHYRMPKTSLKRYFEDIQDYSIKERERIRISLEFLKLVKERNPGKHSVTVELFNKRERLRLEMDSAVKNLHQQDELWIRYRKQKLLNKPYAYKNLLNISDEYNNLPNPNMEIK